MATPARRPAEPDDAATDEDVTHAEADAEADADADARALASTVRLRILRLCLDEPRTNREIAERLGRNPATTLHHVRTLVDRGFLAAEPVRRGNRGAREVPYRATGTSWRTSLAPGQNRVLVDTFVEELALADPATVSITRLGVRLNPADLHELRTRVHGLLEELAAREPDPDGVPYSLFWAMHEDTGRLAR